jgi:hypothetical protein
MFSDLQLVLQARDGILQSDEAVRPSVPATGAINVDTVLRQTPPSASLCTLGLMPSRMASAYADSGNRQAGAADEKETSSQLGGRFGSKVEDSRRDSRSTEPSAVNIAVVSTAVGTERVAVSSQLPSSPPPPQPQPLPLSQSSLSFSILSRVSARRSRRRVLDPRENSLSSLQPKRNG